VAVIELEVQSRAPYEEGISFGSAGPYERIDGVLHFGFDPTAPANQGIVDLELAARGADGLVHAAADFTLLQPVDPIGGTRRLLFDVANRGRRPALRFFNRAPNVDPPTARIEPGDGFLFRRGWTVAWCGWQWDVIRSPALLGLAAPEALDHGEPIVGTTVSHFQPNAPTLDHPLCDRVHQPYPAADLDDPDATLSVRDGLDAPRTLIPRERWRFARDEGDQPVPDDTRVWLVGGFEPGRIYEVIYHTRRCPVVGTGLLAVRDCVSFLRYANAGAGNPAAGRLDFAYGFGVSQSGRFLRHYLYLGLNRDEAGRPVFDGLHIHVAGSRRGQFNHRYAQPSLNAGPSFSNLFPFAYDEQTDPNTGQTDGLLRRQRERGAVPRIIATNTAAEYWRGDGSLGHTDPTGTRDLPPPPEARSYLFAGTQHGPGALPLGSRAADGGRGANPFNVLDYTPLTRAALVNLDAWVTRGIEPPLSVFPRLAAGTAVPAEATLETFCTIPGLAVPSPEGLRRTLRLDFGPLADRGVGSYPPRSGPAYPSYVSAVDGDGNEIGGVRLPEQAVPVATYTGWDPRDPETGGAGQYLDMLGSTCPFPPTAAERERRRDPRPSIAERYPNRDDYLRRVREVAARLVAAGYLLDQDAELTTQLALAHYDAFAGPAG
jgi:hypothetical protein